MVTTLTDNTNRANMAIKAVTRKAEAKIAAVGAVLFKFDSKVRIMNNAIHIIITEWFWIVLCCVLFCRCTGLYCARCGIR